MSNALIIPKYSISKSLYSKSFTKGLNATNFNEYDSQIILSELINLNYAGDFKLSETNITESRITIAPDYGTFLLLIIDSRGNAYFILYDLNEFNDLLDQSSNNFLSLK